MITKYEPVFLTRQFGEVKLHPSGPFTAGTYTQLEFIITIGEYGIDDGGHIKLAWPVTNSFGIPQFEYPDEENYTTVTTNGSVKLEVGFSHNNYTRPFMPCITIKVFDGSLQAGELITITLGSQSSGGKGLKVQTYIENQIEFKVPVDPFGTNKYTELPNSPKIDVISGEMKHLTLINPSTAVSGDPFWALIRADDFLGNTASGYSGTLELRIGDYNRRVNLNQTHKGKIRLDDIVLNSPGTYYPELSDMNGITTKGPPIMICDLKPQLQLYWGDLHGQTGETVGSGTIEEYLKFGRDDAALDYISHAANAFQITIPIWENTQKAIKSFHKPNRFITFLGYEWSGVTSAGGDHNVYYLKDDMPIHRCSHALIEDISDLDTDRYPVSELYREFHGREDVMIIPHIGGRRATLDIFDESLTPFIEIVSVHGHFDWFAQEALGRKLKTGFIASSDTHSGRPGNTFPVSYIEAVRAGLTAVYAKELTREALWDAYKRRHVYGTTSARIIISFESGSYMMGDEIKTETPEFSAHIVGTNPLEKVEIYRGLDLIYNHPLLQVKTPRRDAILVRWTGARTQYRRRNLDWSGKITIDNGKIIRATPYAFDLDWEGITDVSSSSIQFISTTAGDYDGILIEYEGDEETTIDFNSNFHSVRFNPHSISSPHRTELGLIEAAFEIIPIYEEEYPTDVQFEFKDENYTGGAAAFYLKVLQTDGEKAWTSPIFVNWEDN